MRELSEIEQRTFDYIKKVGEIQTINLPDKRMWGAIPNLSNLGLIDVFNKYTNRYFKSKKKKFVKISEN